MKIENTPRPTTPAAPGAQPHTATTGVKPAWTPPTSDKLDAAWKRVRPEAVRTQEQAAAVPPRDPELPLAALAGLIGKLEQALGGSAELQPVLSELRNVLAEVANLPQNADSRMSPAGGQVEYLLHGALQQSGNPAVARTLATVQGQPGQSPLGYPPGSSGPPAQPNPNLQAQARQLRESGALGTRDSKPAAPPLSESERRQLDGIIAKANDDTAVALSSNAKAMSGATPEQKAKLVRELMSGHTSDKEDQAIARILQSCTSKAEYDKVLQLAGGKKAVLDEIDDKGAKGALAQLDGKWESEQKAAAGNAIGLLEQCQTPEQAKQIAAELGGTELKHQVKDPEQLKRLEALAQRFDMPALGYGMPPEAVQQKRSAMNQAITKEDSGLAARLAEDKDAMKVASPSEKAGLIRELQRGWTKDSQDMAIYKILASCTSRAEFDEVIELSGGREVMKDMDHGETKAKMNELCGAWGRADMAEDPKRAAQFANVMADPQKQAQLSATRPPTPGEVNQVGGSFPMNPGDANDPAMRQASQAADAVRQGIQNKAFDINWDPQAKTELVLEQRRREIDGRPKLDFTGLTAEADKITSAPDFDKRVAEFQKQYNDGHPLGKLDAAEAREKYVTLHMENVARQHGISEQTMKALVTQRMGQVYNEGAGQMSAYGKAIAEPLKRELAQVEAAKGPNSPEAVQLRERIGKLEGATGAYTNHLGSVGEVYSKMFPVPPSFAENFVSAFSFIADIAAAVASCFPGIGQAIGGVYFGVKAVVAAAKGDMLGMFSSVASALPGVGSAIGGAAGAAVKTAGRALQTGIGTVGSIAKGDVLGALGSIAGGGAGVSPVFDYAQRGLKLADGIGKGDVAAIAGAAGGLTGPLASNPVVQNVTQAIPFLDAVAKGDAARALGAAANGLGPLAAGNPDVQRALSVVNDGSAFVGALQSGNYGRALGAFNSAFEQIGAGPEAQAVTQSFHQLTDMVGAFGSGSAKQVADTFQNTLGSIAGGSFTRAFTGLSNAATNLLHSTELANAMQLTQAGSNFLGAIGSGELSRVLQSTGTGGELASLLEQARPLVQSMARGEFDHALGELRKVGAAGAFERLEPLADLAQADFLASLHQTIGHLNRLSRMVEDMHKLEDFEEGARRLQQRFGQNTGEMAEHLLKRSGYVRSEEPFARTPEEAPLVKAAWHVPLR